MKTLEAALLTLFLSLSASADESSAEQGSGEKGQGSTESTEASEPAEPDRRAALDAAVEEILSRQVDDQDYGEAVRCIGSREYDRLEPLGNRGMLFYGRRGKVWLNQYRGRGKCGGSSLRHLKVVLKRSRTLRVCEHDRIAFVDPSPFGFQALECVLGLFEPITMEQAQFLEDTAEIADRPRDADD